MGGVVRAGRPRGSDGAKARAEPGPELDLTVRVTAQAAALEMVEAKRRAHRPLPADTKKSGLADSSLRAGGHENSGSAVTGSSGDA